MFDEPLVDGDEKNGPSVHDDVVQFLVEHVQPVKIVEKCQILQAVDDHHSVLVTP